MFYYRKIVPERNVLGHFRVTSCFCNKTSLRTKPVIKKFMSSPTRLFSCKSNSFLWKVLHEDSFRNRGRRQLGNGLSNDRTVDGGHIYLIQEYISIINAVGRAHVSHHLLHWPRDRVSGEVRWPAIYAARKWRICTNIDTKRLWAYRSMPHGGVGCLWCGGGVWRISWCRLRVMT